MKRVHNRLNSKLRRKLNEKLIEDFYLLSNNENGANFLISRVINQMKTLGQSQLLIPVINENIMKLSTHPHGAGVMIECIRSFSYSEMEQIFDTISSSFFQLSKSKLK